MPTNERERERVTRPCHFAILPKRICTQFLHRRYTAICLCQSCFQTLSFKIFKNQFSNYSHIFVNFALNLQKFVKIYINF